MIVYQITAENEYARLVTYLETLLTMIWVFSAFIDSSQVSHYRGNTVASLSELH